MTTAALTPAVNYIEDGVTLNFAVPFRYLTTSHIAVDRISASGTVTRLVLGVGYTATPGLTDAGGTLTLISTVAGAKLRIRRVTPRSQSTDYATNDTFPAESHEAALDRAMLIDQEQDVQIADTALRALLVPDGETGGTIPDKNARVGKFLSFDAQGQPIVASGTGADAGLRGDLASLSDNLGPSLLGIDAGMNGFSVPSTVRKIIKNGAISVKALGAVGDGTLHPLAEFYPSLALAQITYPFATSLAQSIDWAAIQLAYLIAHNAQTGVHPDVDLGFGMFVINETIQGYDYVNMRGRGAGTSNSGPPTNGYLTRGYQTTILAAPGFNGDMIAFNARSSPTAVFTASISGNTMIVTAVARGTIGVGNGISTQDEPLAFGTALNAYGTAGTTGTGGEGTYVLIGPAQTVASTTMVAGNVLSDTSISRVCFRGNWTGPGDATNTTGRAISFDGVYMIQNCYIEECEFHNFAQDAVFCNVVPLPCRFRRLWGRYLGGSVVRINYNARRGTHSIVMEDIQGDYIGGVAETVDAAGNALVFQPALIFIDYSLRRVAGGNAAAESWTFRDLKHEISSSASSPTAYSPNTVHLHDVDRATVSVENANALAANVAGGGTPATNAILLITGNKYPFYRVSNSRMGSSVAVVDYLVDDQVRGFSIDKSYRDYSFTRELSVTYLPDAQDFVERTGQMTESTAVRDVYDRYRRDAAGKQVWGDGSASPDTNLYREAPDRLRTDDAFTALRFLQRGGAALVAGDFAFVGWGTGATIAVDPNSTDGRWRITITAGTTPAANPACKLTYKAGYPIPTWVQIQQAAWDVAGGVAATGAAAAVLADSTSYGGPATSYCSFTYVGTPVAGATYVFEGLVF